MRETKLALALLPALWPAAHGAAPLLAPGILAMAACVAIAATYAHPVLADRSLATKHRPEVMSLDSRTS